MADSSSSGPGTTAAAVVVEMPAKADAAETHSTAATAPAPAPPAQHRSLLSRLFPCASRRAEADAKRRAAAKEYDTTDHLPTLEELAAKYPDSGIDARNVANSRGLTSAQAAALLAKHGRNQLTPPAELPEWAKFLLLFTDTFMILLQLAGWFCILASGLSGWDRTNLTLGIVLFIVVLLTVVMTHIQNRQTASVMAGFTQMLPDNCKVLRNGVITPIDPRDLVPGDIITLASGGTAPADVRLISCADLKVDFSSLTGEPDAIRMKVNGVSREPHESKCLVFSSCGIVEGEAFGLVIRTGDRTFIGGIAALATATDGNGTTMEREIHAFVRFVAGIALATAIVFFIIGAIRMPNRLLDVFINAFIVVLVANVPEGLPATVTSCLTITAKRMGSRNVLIKKMEAIETLGSATVICTDKTGTLTMNRMTVVDLWFDCTLARPPPKRAKPLALLANLPFPYASSPLSSSHAPLPSLTVSHRQLEAMMAVSQAGGTIGAGVGTVNRRGAAALLTIGPGAAATLGRASMRASGGYTLGTTAPAGSGGKGTTTGSSGYAAHRMPSSFITSHQQQQQQQRSALAANDALAATAIPVTATGTGSSSKGVSITTSPHLAPSIHHDSASATGGYYEGVNQGSVRILLPPTAEGLPPTTAIVPLPAPPMLAVGSDDGYHAAIMTIGRRAVRDEEEESQGEGRMRLEKAVFTPPSTSTGTGDATGTGEGGAAATSAASEGEPQPAAGSTGTGNTKEGSSAKDVHTASGAGTGAAAGGNRNADNDAAEDDAAPPSRLSSFSHSPSTMSYYGSFSSFGAFAGSLGLDAPQAASGGASSSNTGSQIIPMVMGAGGRSRSASAMMAGALASWRRSNSYMRLVIAAGVCNRAAVKQPSSTDNTQAGGATAGTGTGKAPPRPFFAAADGSDDEESLQLEGDASDQGLYRFVHSVVPVPILRLLFPKVHEIPFNSTVKWSYAVIREPDQLTTVTGTSSTAQPEHRPVHIGIMKGAPEVILTKCTHYLHNGRELPIDAAFSESQRSAYTIYGSSGKRVLGFAYKAFSAPPSDDCYRTDETACPKEGLVYAGMVALMDPPKPGVPEAISQCHTASVRVTMVTGDHPLTAEAIARKVGIITGKTAREVAAEDGVDEESIPLSDPRIEAVVYSGSDIATKLKTTGDWDAVLCKPQIVFARTTPQQKLTIVENYQRRGEIVAATGDGVNDSPALKKADIGVSMAITGSSVSKAAADVLLLDDNFASIVAAIAEGRLLFDNLKKSIAYTLAHLWPELLPVFLNVAFSFPLALPGLIILTIDLFIEQGPAISFAYEEAEGSVMMRPPRDQKNDRLVSMPLLLYTYVIAGSVEMLLSMGAFFCTFINRGIPVSALAFTADTYWQSSSPDYVVNGRVYGAGEQVSIYNESVAAWYATLVLCQFWHVWLCKTRVTSLFSHNIFANMVTLLGAALAITLCVAVVFIPGLQWLFNTSNLAGVIWPFHLIFPVVMLAFTEFTKWQARTNPDGRWARIFGW